MIDYLVHDESGNVLLFWLVFGSFFVGSLLFQANKIRKQADKRISDIILAIIVSTLMAFGAYIVVALIGIMIFGI